MGARVRPGSIRTGPREKPAHTIPYTATPVQILAPINNQLTTSHADFPTRAYPQTMPIAALDRTRDKLPAAARARPAEPSAALARVKDQGQKHLNVATYNVAGGNTTFSKNFKEHTSDLVAQKLTSGQVNVASATPSSEPTSTTVPRPPGPPRNLPQRRYRPSLEHARHSTPANRPRCRAATTSPTTTC